jgi:hypothetical protein
MNSANFESVGEPQQIAPFRRLESQRSGGYYFDAASFTLPPLGNLETLPALSAVAPAFPDYPAIAAQVNLHGTVKLKIWINPDAGAFESDAVLRFAENFSGSYNFVTALPVSQLIVSIRSQGVDV